MVAAKIASSPRITPQQGRCEKRVKETVAGCSWHVVRYVYVARAHLVLEEKAAHFFSERDSPKLGEKELRLPASLGCSSSPLLDACFGVEKWSTELASAVPRLAGSTGDNRRGC